MSRRGRNSKKRLNSLLMMLVLTAMLLIFSTYAWFSSNKEVSITGIKAKVAAAEGLQISLDAEKWTNNLTVNEEALNKLKNVDVGGGETLTKNNFNWPTTLSPVSTDGHYENGDFVFYSGNVSGDNKYLTDVEENTTGMIAFDLYFKNSSSADDDNLLLNVNSLVEEIKTGVEAATTGKEITGLMYSARVGILFYENTADYTMAPTDIRSLGCGNGKSVIWEPGANKHIQMITNNDSRVSESETLENAFKTLALANNTHQTANIDDKEVRIVPGIDASDVNDTGLVGADLSYLGTIDEDAKADIAGNFAIPYTNKTSNKIDAQTTLKYTTADGTESTENIVKLAGNKITKTRVYIWLEGQDPDCLDVASQGQNLNVVLNFTKPAREGTGTGA